MISLKKNADIRLIRYLICFALIAGGFFPREIHAQQENPEELRFRKALSEEKRDSVRVQMMLKFSHANKYDLPLRVYWSEQAVNEAHKSKLGLLEVIAAEKTGDAYWFSHDFSKASKFYFRQLRIADSLNLEQKKARAWYNIGWIKCIQQEAFNNRAYLLNALDVFQKVNDTVSILESYQALAGTYQSMGRRDKKYNDSAIYYYRNLVYYTEKKGKLMGVLLRASYGDFLTELGRYKEAKKYLIEGCRYASDINDSANYAMAASFLAKLYSLTDSVDKAMQIYQEVIPIMYHVGNIEGLVEVYLNRSKIYALRGDFRAAYQDHLLYKKFDDSLTKSVFKSDLSDKEREYEIAKRESNIRRLEQQNELSELKNRQNRYVIFGLLFVALLVTFMTLSLSRSNKARKQANIALNEKNRQVEEQKKKVEERNLDITNSINYAKRIQEAILPAKEIKYRLFPDAFVLFLPKDIVSGDFYWFSEKNGRRLISAIDCTGHGVPGAFMSMIGNTFIHEAVNEKGIARPAEVLDDLRNHVIDSLKQTDVIDSTKDGMDMALLSFDDEKGMVEFAGANNPLWLIRDGIIKEYKGDNRPIGFYRGEGLPFTNHAIPLQKGDCLYIFTDGLADQFGGPEGKKFKYGRFRELLLSIHPLSMAEQEQRILQAFNDWKGDLEQVDDVCVIGIRV